MKLSYLGKLKAVTITLSIMAIGTGHGPMAELDSWLMAVFSAFWLQFYFLFYQN